MDFEKPTISSQEYASLQINEIRQSIIDPEFIEKVRTNLGLDKNQIPEKNVLVDFWIKENAESFRTKTEQQYNILDKAS